MFWGVNKGDPSFANSHENSVFLVVEPNKIVFLI